VALGLRSYARYSRNSRSSNATFIPSTLLGTTTQANLEPILEKAKTSQARKRRREPERLIQRAPRAGTRFARERKKRFSTPPSPPRLRRPLANAHKPQKNAFLRGPTPIFLQEPCFYALSCKNAFRTSSGVSRTPSSGTPSRERASCSACFFRASPWEFGNKSWLYAQSFRWRRLCSSRSRRRLQECQ